MSNRQDPVTALGMSLALALAAPSLTASILLACGVALSPVTLLLTWAAVAAWTWRRVDAGRNSGLHSPLTPPRAVVIGAAGGIVALAMAAESRIFDLSYDGQTYHQVAVRALARGWNPVWSCK